MTTFLQTQLQDPRFDFIFPAGKAFILAFDAALAQLGYDCGDRIGSGYCWGCYMLIYARTGAKSPKVVARVYLRESSTVLRLFLNAVDQHRAFIEQAPATIREVFTGPHGDCQHCHNEREGVCRFRKTYTLEGRRIEKCNGITFEFHEPTLEKLPDYLSLFTEFFPSRSRKATQTESPA